jgi:hypothetical protein
VTVPWASSLREAFPSCPNHSLYWKILGDSIARGARAFDFGRSHLDSGTYRFKVQWGARPVPLEWSLVGRDGVRAPAGALKPQDHGWLTSAWSKLPLWLANRLGPLLRGHIPN